MCYVYCLCLYMLTCACLCLLILVYVYAYACFICIYVRIWAQIHTRGLYFTDITRVRVVEKRFKVQDCLPEVRKYLYIWENGFLNGCFVVAIFHSKYLVKGSNPNTWVLTVCYSCWLFTIAKYILLLFSFDHVRISIA